jgi:CHAT domain-containing protein/tetratricopeptide (TPR) repeat protein
MQTEHSPFPSDETLAAYIDGRLDEETRKRVVAHMAECEECFEVAMGGREVAGRDDKTVVPFHPARIAVLGGLATAATIALVLALTPLRDSLLSRWQDPVKPLIAAAPSHRDIDGRLSGFPYQPLKRNTRGENPKKSTLEDPEYWQLHAALGRIPREISTNSSTKDLHALGVAHLMLGNWDDAVKALESSVEHASGTQNIDEAITKCDDVYLLNDLSAAYYARASHTNQPQDFFKAAGVAEAAWQRKHTAEVAWNRAIALDRLKMPEKAAAAYREYLSIEKSSDWAKEAQERLEDVEAPTHSQKWEEVRPLLDSRDAAQIARIVRQFPQQSRDVVEEIVLRTWPAHVSKGEATDELQTARVVAEILSSEFGDTMFLDAIRSIDQSANPSARRRVANAHATLGRARHAYQDGNVTLTEVELSSAIPLLRSLNSPMRFEALFVRAATRYFANDYGGLLHHAQFLRDVPEQYLNLRARTAWILGLGAILAGRPHEGLAEYRRALDLFRRTGDTNLEAGIHNLIAEALDFIDDRDGAWRERYEALQLAAKEGVGSSRLLGVMHGCARAAVAEGDLGTADLLLDSACRIALKTDDRIAAVEDLAWRARVARLSQRSGDSYAAEARRLAGTIADSHVRQRELLTVSFSSLPKPGLRNLDEAVAFAKSSDKSFDLPRLLLERGTFLYKLNRFAEAAADFEDGLNEAFRRWSDSSAPFSLVDRSVVAALTIAAIDARAAIGDVAAVLRISERASSSELDKGSPAALSSWQNRLPEGLALVKYVCSRDVLFVFVVTPRKMAIKKIPIRRAEIETATARWLDSNDTSAAQVVSAAFIHPIENELTTTTTIVVVDDPTSSFVPLAAVRTKDDRVLISHFRMSRVPSIASALKVNRHRAEEGEAVIIAAAAPTGSRDELPGAREEADDLRQLYGNAALIDPAKAGRKMILRRMQSARLIHFAGHGLTDQSRPALSAIVLPAVDGAEQFLYAHDIAALKLHASVVILSSCRGAARRLPGGQRSFSVADAFLAGGAEAVVASSQAVDDRATRTFALALHRRLARGEAVADAVRAVQLEFANSSNATFRSARFWATFDVVGSPDATL